MRKCGKDTYERPKVRREKITAPDALLVEVATRPKIEHIQTRQKDPIRSIRK